VFPVQGDHKGCPYKLIKKESRGTALYKTKEMVNPAGSNRKPRKRRYMTISGDIIGRAGVLSRVNAAIEGFLIQIQPPFFVIQHGK